MRFLPSRYLPRPIFVKLSSIQHFVKLERVEQFVDLSYRRIVSRQEIPIALDGEWDLEIEPEIAGLFEANSGYRRIWQIFSDVNPAGSTGNYKEYGLSLFGKESAPESEDDLDYSTQELAQQLNAYISLFEDIKNNGYKTQVELGNPPIDEVTVCIGRNGNLLWYNGAHRFAMARILEIEYLPVRIWTVHGIWAEQCFRTYGGNLLEAVNKGLDAMDHRRLARPVDGLAANNPAKES